MNTPHQLPSGSAPTSGLRDLITRAKGATTITSSSVREHINRINAEPITIMSIGRDPIEQRAIEELDRYRAGTAHLVVKQEAAKQEAAKQEEQPAARSTKTRKPRSPKPATNDLPPAHPVPAQIEPEVVVFNIENVGDIENEVSSVQIDDDIISVWSYGDPEGRGKFRASHNLFLTISYKDISYPVWSPGIHINNANLGVTVSIYVRNKKD